jgi:prepilin-type N-terminal cleavage/methylation domain-containing protein
MHWRKSSKQGCFFKNRGFTTVELVVTIAVMAALAAISVPIFKNFSSSYNSKLIVRDIVSQMQLARVHAVKSRVTTVVAFYPKNHLPAAQANSYLIYEDDNDNWIQDAGEKLLVPRTYMPTQVNLQSATFTANGSGQATETTSCGFDSHGTAARTGVVYVTGDVVLQNNNNQTKNINLNASGKTKISTL